MLWIGIHFPSLAIEAFGQPPPTRHGDDAPALAVCAQGVVLQACPRAQAQGVAPGMKRATALARRIEKAPEPAREAGLALAEMEQILSDSLELLPVRASRIAA